MPSPPTSSPRPPPLLLLPLELRHQIYSHLLSPLPIPHPLPSVGITSVQPSPPSISLLLIHPQLTLELVTFFFALATWKLVISHAFNFYRIDPCLDRLAAHPVLARIRSVELVFFCDVQLLREYPSFGIASVCGQMRRRGERACEVLRDGATALREVVVSWVDTTEKGEWEEKVAVLGALRRLGIGEGVEGERSRSEVMFRIGEVRGGEGGNRGMVVDALREALGSQCLLHVGGVRESGMYVHAALEETDVVESRAACAACDLR